MGDTGSTHPSETSRRVVAKRAAWTVPVLMVAATAKARAASPGICEQCVDPLLGGGLSTAVVTNNRGRLVIAGAFTATATECTGLVSAGIATTQRATLTMSDGRIYTTTANLGVGPMAAGVVALSNGIAFPNVVFPDGLYASAAGVGSLPVYPTRLCFDVLVPIQVLGGAVEECPQTVCFRPTFVGANLGIIPSLTHDGTVTFGTTWVGA